jgi:hypothetical protein
MNERELEAVAALVGDDTIPATVSGLRLRRVLGRHSWRTPRRFGVDGWSMARYDGSASVIVTAAEYDGIEWVHASIAHNDRTMPTYEELKLLHEAAFGTGYAYQLFVPPTRHVNIHEYALHLYGRADGAAVTPDFGAEGSI